MVLIKNRLMDVLKSDSKKEELINQILEYDKLIHAYVEQDEPKSAKELHEYSEKELERIYKNQEARLKFLIEDQDDSNSLIN